MMYGDIMELLSDILSRIKSLGFTNEIELVIGDSVNITPNDDDAYSTLSVLITDMVVLELRKMGIYIDAVEITSGRLLNILDVMLALKNPDDSIIETVYRIVSSSENEHDMFVDMFDLLGLEVNERPEYYLLGVSHGFITDVTSRLDELLEAQSGYVEDLVEFNRVVNILGVGVYITPIYTHLVSTGDFTPDFNTYIEYILEKIGGTSGDISKNIGYLLAIINVVGGVTYELEEVILDHELVSYELFSLTKEFMISEGLV